MRPRAALLLAAVPLLACSDPNDARALRNLGEECVSCHKPGAKAERWPFTAGGTVYRTAGDDPAPGLEGVAVTLTDADGRIVALVSNRAGNFWTKERLRFPVAARLQRAGAERASEVAAGPCRDGTCNGCHTRPPQGGARGRLFAPR